MVLKNFLNTFLNFFRHKKVDDNVLKESDEVPEEILENEKILRTILAPSFIKKDLTLRSSAFRPDSNGETSVNRLTHTTIDFCKQHGKKIENPKNDKSYSGFALLYSTKIFELECFLECKKEDDNPYHANITFGAKPEKGQQLPPEINQKVQKLCEAAKIYIDNHVTHESWLDGEIL